MQDGILPASTPSVFDNATTAAVGQQAPGAAGGYLTPGTPANAAPAGSQPLCWGRLPLEMRQRPQWLLAGPDAKGKLKVPMSARPTGELYSGSSTNRSCWLTFEEAASAATAHGYGIGYVLSADDPFTCIDLDIKNEVSAPGEPTAWTTPEQRERLQSICNTLNSYTELSQSKQGVHIWVLGKVGKGVKRDGVEVYSQERFIACTGDVVNNSKIVDRQAMLTTMVSQMGEADEASTALRELDQQEDDATVFDRAKRAQNGQKFEALWRGDWAALKYPSQSEADAALMAMLAYYSKSNEQCRRLFRQSKLGEREKAQKDDRYLDRTLKVVRGRQAREERDGFGGGSVEHGRRTAETLLANFMLKRSGALQENGAWGRVSIADVCTNPATPIEFLIEDLLPAREVTLLPADGGAGKSLLTLTAAVCQAMGLQFMGKSVRRCKVIFFSGEDDERVLRGRLKRICEHYCVDPVELAEMLLVIDASESPCLFTEVCEPEEGRRGVATRNLEDLDERVREWGARVVVIDNASDTYDANENVRQFVRAFVKGLKSLAKKHDAAIWLLAHLDKTSVRGGGGKAQFSGSTAWHNSVRSRLLLGPNPNVDGQLVLSQEKSNHGRTSADIFLAWTPEGVLMHAGGGAHVPVASPDEIRERVLGLIRAHYERGQYISTSFAPQASTGAFATLSVDANYPRGLDKGRLATLLRQAMVAGLLEVEKYVHPTRRGHTATRWRVL